MKNAIKYTIFYLIFTTSIVVAHSLDQDSVIHIENEQDLKNLLESNLGPTAISFHMDYCGWCIKMRPIFEDLASDDQFEHITFYSVNGPISKASTLIEEILNETLIGYPTIFFMNQGKLIDKQVGGAGREVIMKKLNGLLSSPSYPDKKKIKKTTIKQKQIKTHKQKVALLAAASATAA